MGSRNFGYYGLQIETCEGVYEPAEDTFLLLDNIECGKRVLEIGTGSGIISIFCAKKGSNVTAVDISQKAVECALRNAETNDVSIEVLQSNLFERISGLFDTIIFNPPYLPTEDDIEGSEQWNGGEDGFRVTRPFLKGSKHHIEKNGKIYIILTDLTDIDSLRSEFTEFRFKELARKSFFYERIILYELTLA